MSEPLLMITDLRTEFPVRGGVIRAVDGVSLEVAAGQAVGIVGESGCGKSVTALSVMRLVPRPGRVVAGRVEFDGNDLVARPEREMRELRGSAIGMIFQEPMTSLNPVYSVGEQVAETLRFHRGMKRGSAWSEAVEMLKRVGIPAAERRAHDYPHHLSGGMRQRAMIAMALACRPRLLIADEPTTALDVTIQAQILDLLHELRDELGMALLIITHDFGVVADICERVVVMYAGQVVEEGRVDDVLRSPQMPYTEALLRSVPQVGLSWQQRLEAIPGTVPNPLYWPAGCRFAPRCLYRFPKCDELPPLFNVGGQQVRCWLCDGTRRTPALEAVAGGHGLASHVGDEGRA